MCITNPLKISDFQGNLLHMLLFSQKHAFYFSILRIKEGLSHVQQPLNTYLKTISNVLNRMNCLCRGFCVHAHFFAYRQISWTFIDNCVILITSSYLVF